MYPVWIVLSVLVTLGGAERFNCRGRILGAYYADAKAHCKAFHVCVRVAGGGIRDFRFFCPPGTLFHQEAQTCTDWGDDDPLACPADLYDGQFDLYKIGSGFDTKKVTAPAKSEDEPEFNLQRAETGDRRLQQQNSGASDLRTAHSSDFFSGQRDRGRDDAPSPSSSRQSFRRPTTPRSTPSTTQYTTVPPPPSPPQRQPSQNYNTPQKSRKLLRKRPVYTPVSTPPSPLPTTYAPATQTQSYLEPQNRNVQIQYRPTVPQPSVPPQFKEFKDEYVEVSRVTPKTNKYFIAQSTSSPQYSISTTAAPFSKKEGLVELFTYDTKSTPSFTASNANQGFKVRNSFNVAPEAPNEQDFIRTKALKSNNAGRNPPSTVDYSSASRVTTNAPYKNFNSVSYEPEKNNYVSPGSKQNYNYYNSPSTTPATTTYYTTARSEPPANINTVAYNTNNGFNYNSNYVHNSDDDGQYRPPQGEDDGQYRPELYERERERETELLSGAHSLNIAASGNRLPEDQKSYSKSQNYKPVAQTAAPRPFRPAPTPSSTTIQPEVTYTTTFRPPTVNTQRTFDYQTYTTTARPETPPVSKYVPISNPPPRPPTTPSVVRTPEPAKERPQNRPAPPTFAPSKAPSKPSTQVPHFAQPANNKEDNSYDYAYYDSDPGFSEYDRIEEFGKTKSKA